MTFILDRTSSRHGIRADIARSWLLVSGLRPDTFDAAHDSAADQIILDIEDAVDPAFKAGARRGVVDWFLGGGSAWVRINARSTRYWRDDVAELAGVPGLAGVMLAKTESVIDVEDTAQQLGGTTPVIALIESALGIENAVTIAQSGGVFRLAFGSGDYRRDTGASADDLAMAYPRSRLVVASRIGELPGPIDGPTVVAGYPALRQQSEHAVALGLTGKLCLRLDQLPVVNEAISPTAADVLWARTFLEDFAASGGVVRDGSDLPRLARAQKIQGLAHAFGISPS
ncbi:citrate lyase subunit beta/citryl-CoA lyase [Leifsonia shinshuensis]|nr:CoA ester lyase [Leifsonia shinshuensis]MDR6972887.1 citrate lyase subunit beta/citryl-CoA lyase [Leifsonia shinshuensis]